MPYLLDLGFIWDLGCIPINMSFMWTRHFEKFLFEAYNRFADEGKAKMTVICYNFGAILKAVPMCQFVFGG